MQIGEHLENKDDLVSGDFATRLIILDIRYRLDGNERVGHSLK